MLELTWILGHLVGLAHNRLVLSDLYLRREQSGCLPVSKTREHRACLDYRQPLDIRPKGVKLDGMYQGVPGKTGVAPHHPKAWHPAPCP